VDVAESDGTMTEENKRKHSRISTLNLSHVSTTAGDDAAFQGMGRTLNLSESGVRLETAFEVPLGRPLVITMGLEDELLELSGKAVYCKPGEEGQFETGIQFDDIDPDVYPKLKWFILALGSKGAADE
jgi:hypothetical protein